ncbi:MAG: monovalent cation:proton antiporter-2 (CPA2) family protein [Granulosicoccus sp.]
MDSFLFQAFIYLLAAVVAVPIAKRFGLGSVLGYLIAGVIIGPVIGLVGSETQDLQHFAEFGVVMMLFLVGLELEPRALWEMRNRLLGLGGLQVIVTTLAIMAFGTLFGLQWRVALVVGLIFSLSSTAIVLQTLNEKGLMKSEGGQSSFSVLLFQDIAVILMLALIPLLALPELAELAHITPTTEDHGSINLMEGLAGWQSAIVTLTAVATVIIGGHFLSRPLFRFLAGAHLREIFTAGALLLVIATALLMTLCGLSPALGTFLAGVVLANSEFRHELESDIEPFKGLLLGLFFITVGAGIDFQVLFSQLGVILGLTLGMMAVKALILLVLTWLFNIRGADRWLFALSCAQAGEFGFVLLSFSVQNAVMPGELSETLLLVVALSMLLTPALFILFDKVILPRISREQSRADDEITDQGVAIIAGYGRFGQIVNRVLMANGYKTVVLDYRADLIDNLRKFGVRVFFGDASRPDLLHAAGLHQATLLVVAIDDKEQSLELIKHARREVPQLHIIARAHDRVHVYQLYESGANDIVRETFDSAVRAARYSLQALGVHPYDAEQATTVFVEHDRAGIRHLAKVWRSDIPIFDNNEYIDLAKDVNRQIEEAMLGDRSTMHDKSELGWLPPGNSRGASKKHG